MAFQVTTATEKIWGMTSRIKVVQGSTSAGKTWAILPTIADDCLYQENTKALVTGQTYPAVMSGPRTIFEEAMRSMNRWDDKAWNGLRQKYTFPNRSWIKFAAFDTVGKAKADDKRDILFINEANHVPWEIADTLMTRSKQTYIDFNPDHEFWAHKEVLPQPNAELLVLNYLDNEALPWETLEDLMIKRAKAFYNPEGDPNDPDNVKSEYWANWWRVYGLGLVGSLEGQIYKDWTTTNFWPDMPRYVYGLDFGYTNDYTALTQNCYYQGALYTKEKYYKVGYNSDDFIEFLYLEGVTEHDPIICDHDHTAVEALKGAGFRAFKADKRPGSVLSGVNALCGRDVRVFWTSSNILKEQRMYFWDTRHGETLLNKPVDANNHCFIAGTEVYTLDGSVPIEDVKVGDKVVTENGANEVACVWSNGFKEVYDYILLFDTLTVTLTCTPEHLIKTKAGWVEISKIRAGQEIYLSRFLTEKSTSSIGGRSILAGVVEKCIGMFGSTTTALDRKVSTYTTLTETPTTTMYLIWNSPSLKNTYAITAYVDTIVKTLSTFNAKAQKLLRRGIKALKGETGIKSMLKIQDSVNGILVRRNAFNAKKHLAELLTILNFAPRLVKRSTGEPQESTTKTGGALNARNSLKPTDTVKSSFVQGHVLTGIGSRSAGKQRVYDLTVCKTHSYIANGVLVHNCMDSIRYADDYLFNPMKDHYIKQEKMRQTRGGRRKMVYS